MARVKGPLFSMSASGALGGAIVFSSWKGRPVVRELVIPSNPNSLKQIAFRAMMRFLSQQWATIGAGDQSSWLAKANSQSISPFNAFTQFNMLKWEQFNGPQQNVVPGAQTDPVLGAPTATGGVGQARITQATTTLNTGWGLIIFGDTSAIGTPVQTQVRYIAPLAISGQVTDVTIRGLTPATWHFKTVAFREDGFKEAASADITAVVT